MNPITILFGFATKCFKIELILHNIRFRKVIFADFPKTLDKLLSY